jgi:hypothetical protein
MESVPERVPDSDGVQQLLVQLMEEDADRRGAAGVPLSRDGWDDDGWTRAGRTFQQRTTRF